MINQHKTESIVTSCDDSHKADRLMTNLEMVSTWNVSRMYKALPENWWWTRQQGGCELMTRMTKEWPQAASMGPVGQLYDNNTLLHPSYSCEPGQWMVQRVAWITHTMWLHFYRTLAVGLVWYCKNFRWKTAFAQCSPQFIDCEGIKMNTDNNN